MKLPYPPTRSYRAYGTPVRHRNPRKLKPGWTYDSEGYLLSPARQLVFRRKSEGQIVLVEGWNVQMWDALAGVRRLAERIKKTPKRK